jgi:hypothetical protein
MDSCLQAVLLAPVAPHVRIISSAAIVASIGEREQTFDEKRRGILHD